MSNNRDIVVLPDAHACPELDNSRAEWLNGFLRAVAPSTFVCLGDVGDFRSLFSAEKGQKSFEGQRYLNDCNAVQDFLNKATYNLPKMRKVITLGNHEYRVAKQTNNNPELAGVMDVIGDCELRSYFDTIIGFKDTINISGILFTHYFPSGVLGRPISGPNAGQRLLSKQHRSNISGHSHLLNVADDVAGDGRRLLSIVGGCYVHPRFVGDWNRDTVKLWWNGIIYLRNVVNGYPSSYSFITQRDLQKEYGKKRKS